MAEKKKILIAATSGGHLTEAVSLLFGIPGLEFVIFTERTLRKYGDVKMYMYHRPKNQILTMAKSVFKTLWIILKERPEWVVTTGAECGTAALLAGVCLFRKTMFIETASRFRTKTVAAKICYPFATRFYVQHREALPFYGKKTEYIGGVL